MVATVAKTSLTIKGSAGSNCPSCGFDLPPPSPTSAAAAPKDLTAAQARIAELEREVRAVNDKAAMAINRWAEYEVELARLRSHPAVTSSPTSPPRRNGSLDPSSTQSPTRSPSYLQQGTERISNLLYARKSSTSLRGGAAAAAARPPALQTAGSPTGSAAAGGALSPTRLDSPLPSTPTNMTEDLLEALNREQSLRQEAEGRLTATSKEMEELSAALFEQANEMVADERRARAKLEERVGELEKRDAEKKKRLDRLESAMNRIERVKNLLKE
ncbi:hypothetical protein PWT90_02428 [Aphanocladium album]|nr:hypothetical protein PWT90_02428 [Aphanocladium album]